MKLPVSLIQNEVEGLVDWGSAPGSYGERYFGRPMFWQRGMDVSREDFFLVMGTKGEDVPCGSSALLIFEGDGVVDREKWTCAGKLKDDVSMIDVANCLHRSFERYEEWESRLRSLLFHHDAINEMVRCSREILDNPIMVMNARFQIIAVSDAMQDLIAHGLLGMDREGYVPDEVVNSYKNDAVYQELVWEKEPFYYSNDQVLPGKVLCQNLFCQGDFAARVVVYSIRHDLEEWDPFLLKILTGYLQLVYLNDFEEKEGGWCGSFRIFYITGHWKRRRSCGWSLLKIGIWAIFTGSVCSHPVLWICQIISWAISVTV